MPIPPRTPFYFSCTQCDWKGPVQRSDCLTGPHDYCPDCQSRLVREEEKTFDANSGLLHKLFGLFERS